MSIENPCLTKCSAACCIGEGGWITFQRSDASITPKQIRNFEVALRENGTPYNIIHTFASIIFKNWVSPEGIMFKGRCPFLTTENLCSIYESTERPIGCYIAKPGAKTCNKARSNHGFDPLPISTSTIIPMSDINISV